MSEQRPPERQTSTPPPPPPNIEQQAADIRNKAELAALGLFVSTAGMTAADIRLMKKIVEDLTRELTEATLEGAGTAIKWGSIALIAKSVLDAIEQRRLDELEEIITEIRKANAAAPARDPGELTAARQGARNFATAAYNVALTHVAAHLPEVAGLELRKTWISQSDTKVRPLHRRLHGRTAPVDGDFWRWPATGQKLRFPGDPLAPPDAVINCRCLCWLSWSTASDLKAAVRTLPPMEAVAASGDEA